MAKNKTETAPEAPAPAAPAEAEAPSLGVQDLQNAAQIIDIAMTRGAFRANELTQVGQVYDKLNNFLSFIKEQQEAQAEAQGDESPEEAGE